MWDIGGQEKIRKDWYTYYTHTEFVIIVVDSTDRERLPVTKEELSNMLRHEELKKAAVLIFANKQVVFRCSADAMSKRFFDFLTHTFRFHMFTSINK